MLTENANNCFFPNNGVWKDNGVWKKYVLLFKTLFGIILTVTFSKKNREIR